MTNPSAVPQAPVNTPATPPEPGAPAAPAGDAFAWLSERETTWVGWGTGALLGLLCFVFGARGLYAYWRGEPPDNAKGIPSPGFAAGMFVFGAWVLWVFWNSKMPG